MEEGDDSKATGKMLRVPIPFPSRHYHFYDNNNAGVAQGGVEINDLGQERREAISELATAAAHRAMPVVLGHSVAQPEHP